MCGKKEAFEKATEKIKEKMAESKPTPPSTDSGRGENERGHTNIATPQKER
jgi:hypothetical protein